MTGPAREDEIPATPQEIQALQQAHAAYDYPAVVWVGGVEGHEEERAGMPAVDAEVAGQLRSGDANAVRQGLVSVVYWGYRSNRPRYAWRRVQWFLEGRLGGPAGITQAQVAAAAAAFSPGQRVALDAVLALGLPNFGWMPFVSKLLMFIDPGHHCVLDNQIAKLWQDPRIPHLLGPLLQYGAKIPVTANTATYAHWTAVCAHIANAIGLPRPVDAERATFWMIHEGNLTQAQAIVARASACMNGHLHP